MSLEPIDLAAVRENRIEVIGKRKQRDFDGCQHHKHEVDLKLRRVTCQDCGEILDPIEVILQYVDYWERSRIHLEKLAELDRAYRERERDKELRQWARRVAQHGGVWACRLDGRRTMYWDGGQHA